MTDVNIFLLVDLNNEYFTKNILKDVFEWLSLTWQFASITSCAWRFQNTGISHGNIATWWGGISEYGPPSLTVKEF